MSWWPVFAMMKRSTTHSPDGAVQVSLPAESRCCRRSLTSRTATGDVEPPAGIARTATSLQ